MVIVFTAITKQAEFRSFMCQLDSLEAGLDTISLIAGEGDRLIKAELIDETSTIQLPVKAFDGQLLSEPIQLLEKEWQAILQKQLEWRVAITHFRIKRHRTTIAKLEQAVLLSQQRLQRIKSYDYPRSYHAITVSLLQGTLERLQHNLVTEQSSLLQLVNQSKFR